LHLVHFLSLRFYLRSRTNLRLVLQNVELIQAIRIARVDALPAEIPCVQEKGGRRR